MTEEKKKLEEQEEDERPRESRVRLNPYERTRARVYATGNKWAIENFHATHD